jgi:hypothetical protein
MHLNQGIVNLSTPSALRLWLTFGLSGGRGLKVDPEGALETRLKLASCTIEEAIFNNPFFIDFSTPFSNIVLYGL